MHLVAHAINNMGCTMKADNFVSKSILISPSFLIAVVEKRDSNYCLFLFVLDLIDFSS